MKKNFFILTTLLLAGFFAQAQAPNLTCALTDNSLGSSPPYPQTNPATYRQRTNPNAVWVIPVVVHVIYSNNENVGVGNNISDAQAFNAIEELNKVYRNYYGTSVDCKVQFCLAKIKPDGSATNGIDRIYTTSVMPTTSFVADGWNSAQATFFDTYAWNAQQYMNIWVAKDIVNGGPNPDPFITGRATIPRPICRPYNTTYDLSYGTTRDGVYIENNEFGKVGTASNNTSIGFLSHEVGHWLGLQHIFDGGCNPATSFCTYGDDIGDTPNIDILAISNWSHSYTDQGLPVNCSESVAQCSSSIVPNNYMFSYMTDDCWNRFTQGQANMMDIVLKNFRTSVGFLSGTTAVANTKCGCYPGYDYDWITINNASTTTWNSNKRINGTVFVTNNSTLIINNNAVISLSDSKTTNISSKIIVDKGSKLYINGGAKLTSNSDCSTGMWDGIEVWGAKTLRQIIPNQGYVLIQSGGQIENALVGISASMKDASGNPNLNYTGGIIVASDAVFRNNKTDVEFLPFQNTGSLGNPISNVGTFNNCTFETTALLRSPTTLPYAHASMQDVDGIRFYGCTFRNTALSSYSANNRGSGIISTDAGYFIDQYCTSTTVPCPSYKKSRFDGLTKGVYASYSVSGLRTVKTFNSEFNNVQRGILCVGGAYHGITGNTFTAIPNAQTSSAADATYGVYMSGATNYSISGANSFTGESASFFNNYGVLSENSANTASDISGNSFNNLFSPTQTQQNNGSGTTGLKISCNAYNSAYRYAMSVNPLGGGSLPNQGDGCNPTVKQAGNTWNYNSTLALNQIRSNVAFTYNAGTLSGLNTIPTYYSPIVTRNTCTSGNSNPNTCLVSGGGGGGGESRASLPEAPISDNRILRIGKDPGEQLRQLNEGVRNYLAADKMDEAVKLLEADNSPASRRLLMGTYLFLKDAAKTQSISVQTQDDPDFNTLSTILGEINLNEKTLKEINPVQEKKLRQLASSNSLSKYNAQSILQLAKGDNFPHIAEQWPDEGINPAKRTGIDIAETENLSQAWLSDNAPNPFSETTIIEAFLPDDKTAGNIEIYNTLGEKVKSYRVHNGRNTVEVNLGELGRGVYFYSLIVGGQKLATKKMTLVQ